MTSTDKWIACSERLPRPHIDSVYIWPRAYFGNEIHTGMLTTTKDDSEPAWYVSVYEPNWGSDLHKVTVTHWMPLPPPPLQEKGE